MVLYWHEPYVYILTNICPSKTAITSLVYKRNKKHIYIDGDADDGATMRKERDRETDDKQKETKYSSDVYTYMCVYAKQ